MLKQVFELFTQLFTITQRLNRHEDAIEKVRQELKVGSELTNRLLFEQVRTNDELKRLAEREAEARKLFQLQVENYLLRAGGQLPPAAEALPAAEPPPSLNPGEIESLKAQIADLWTAVQKANEQAAHDQEEIESLKARMAELLDALQRKTPERSPH
ncbi:MAG: hypothetical protein ABI977_04380 [Acidobacteriota bacterium]